MEIKKLPLLGTDNAISIGSGCVIMREDKVLLVRGKGGTQFKFPGGHIDDQENFQQSAMREVMEEIGCQVEIISSPVFFSLTLDNKLQIILVHYLAKITSGEPQPLTEIEEIGWFHVENLPPIFSNIEPVLQAFQIR